MAKKLSGWKTKGMNQDLSVSAFNPEFAFENMNLRLATNDGNTTMSWVNEKGTESVGLFVYTPPSGGQPGGYTPTEIKGVTVGTAGINHMLMLFVTDPQTHYDYIYRLTFIDHTKSTMQVDTLFGAYGSEGYQQSLGFDVEHPLETIVSYESEHIQKVYWTDGINQPRLINVATDNDDKISRYTKTSFDFITTLQLNETVKVKKVLGGGGMFAPGVIQYCFTYYNKYGQESNIFYTTPLYYISHQDRGGSPEDKVDNAFNITVEDLDTNFDYLRIYSIQRTSINATPICKRIQDIEIGSLTGNRITYIDTGLSGDSIDPTELLYKGGNVIHVGTLEQKDNTLFMGDITTPENNKPDIEPSSPGDPEVSLSVGERKFSPIMVSTDSYVYANQLTSVEVVEKEEEGENNQTTTVLEKTDKNVPCAGFKYGDTYRCGVQFQDKTGKWTDPVFIGDKEVVKDSLSENRSVGTGEPLHAPYITANADPQESDDLTIKIKVVNDSSHSITIASEASIVVDSRGNAVKLLVLLGNASSYTIAADGGEMTFDSAIVRHGRNYYGKEFCTDTLRLRNIGMEANCAIEDSGTGDSGVLIMDNVTWDDSGDPMLPLPGSASTATYTFTCTSSPSPEPEPPGPEPPSGDLGEFLYKVGVVSDLHMSADNDEESASTSDDWHDEDDLRAVMNVVLADQDIKFVVSCGDIIESGSPADATPDDDSHLFFDIYSNSYWQNGIRLFTPLGNHDFYGLYESRYGDTLSDDPYNPGNPLENDLSIDGYNTGVKSRLGTLWYDESQEGIQGYGVNGVHPNARMTFDMEGTPSAQYDINYFAYNSFTEMYYNEYSQGGIIPAPGTIIQESTLRAATNYINDNWATLKDKIGGWDQGSMGMRNGYSKLNYWIKKNDDIYVFMSVDYGNDVWPINNVWHDRMIHARTTIDINSSDVYIRRMLEYVQDTGYSMDDEPYNYQYYSPNVLIWLKELIEDNPDKKVYVFSHHFLPHKVGNGDPINDGLPKDGGHSYADISPDGTPGGGMNRGSNVLTGIEFWFLNKLSNSHQNVIWFTGHSHISWENRETGVVGEELVHFTNRDYEVITPGSGSPYIYTRNSNTPKPGYGGWQVSLPSMSKPIVIDSSYPDGYIEKIGDAEMAIMHVYENGVVIKGYKVRENNVTVFDVDNPLVEQTIILRSSSSNSSEPRSFLRSASTPMELTRDSLSSISAQTVQDIVVTVPVIKGTIPANIATSLKNEGYVKARAVVVYPGMQDRRTVCQGVGCPTLYTANHREKNQEESTGDLWAQSSWFFRPKNPSSYVYQQDVNTPPSEDLANLEYMVRDGSPLAIKRVEIQGHYNANNRFTVDWTTMTFHSPDIEFDSSLANLDYASDALDYINVGEASFLKTFSDIDIQTETPAISSKGVGFVKKSFVKDGAYGIISGLFWDDYEVDDNPNNTDDPTAPFTAFAWQKAPMKWMVYLWNRTGSLNNDIERPADSGVQSAILKKKIISNLRFTDTDWITPNSTKSYKSSLFYSDQPEILKLDIGNSSKTNVYMGNIDTMLMSDEMDGMYFALSRNAINYDWHYDSPSFKEEVRWGTFEGSDGKHGNHWYNDYGHWYPGDSDDKFKFMTNVGDVYKDIVLKKCSVRIKYKSTPHVVMTQRGGGSIYGNVNENTLPVFELQRTLDPSTIFGGTSEDALKANIWVPCGEPVRLENTDGAGGVQGDVTFEYSWGDTYYQRWDCLKTYAFTPEDINQVVEIGSFMLETRVNIDGRYDRNRGQLSNLYMSPRNFNLINPVYSQLNNFFTYRIQDDDAYNDKVYPNQITWSKTKTSGADVDLWTNVTLASVLEMDGDKGKVRKLARLNNNLICFQDKGIAQVLYNERVEINTQDGVPIEISNSDKVQGKNYISDSIGCSNKWSMAQTPSGIYFMDSINKAIFMFNGQLNNLSGSYGFNSWSKKNILLTDNGWTPVKYFVDDQQQVAASGFGDFVSYYDKLNQDVLFINKDIALAFSEKLSTFTSFYNYGMSPFLCNVDDTEIWLRTGYEVHEETEGQQTVRTVDNLSTVWKHQAGDYCKFFGESYPYWMTLVGNPEPQVDKIFTNLEFRTTIADDGTDNYGAFTPFEPFDYLETWNEYQHGKTDLVTATGHSAFLHPIDNNTSSLKRKFRIWRCDIPRDNVAIVTEEPVLPENPTQEERQAYEEAMVKYRQYQADVENGIFRKAAHPIDRMRNPWLYLKLMKSRAAQGSLPKAEVHDIVMTYYS